MRLTKIGESLREVHIMKKLKRATIKEELVKLTGDFKKAIVLNQMIYWSERAKDADKFFLDEKSRAKMAMGKQEIDYAKKLEEIDLYSHGWIYKSAEELSEETMMGVSKSTMGRYLNELVANGWLDKRKNPKWKGDNTFQYRVNLVKIQNDLIKLGYSLERYPLTISEHGSSKIEQPVSKQNNQFQNETTLPEITTEITSEINNNLVVEECARVNPFDFYQQNFGIISPYIAERITVWLEEKSFKEAEEIIVLAMKIALENNSKSFSYIDAILKNWLEQNVKTKLDALAVTKEFKSQKGRGSRGVNSNCSAGTSTKESEISAEIERRKRLIAERKNKNNRTE